jgi:hypothetical protein
MANQDGAETSPQAAGMDALTAMLLEQEPEGQPEAQETEAEETPSEPTEGEESQEEEAQEEGEEAEEDAEEPGRYTIKINGQEQKVTLQELKDGYSREQDYRRKTAEVAEQRKAIESKATQYESTLGELQNKLELVGAVLARQTVADDKQLDELAEKDPAAFIRAQREVAKKQAALNAVVQELEAVKAARNAEQSEALEAFKKAEQSALVDKAPEFKHKDTEERLLKYLNDTYGLTKDVYDSVVDHRFRIIAEKARKYDAMQTNTNLKEKQVKKLAPVQKGGALSNQTVMPVEKQKAFEQLRSKPTMAAFAELLR